MKASGIYAIRNLVNGKRYVGSAVYLTGRFCDHRKRLRLGKHHSIKLQRAWDKYGEQAFVFEVLEVIPDKELLIVAEQKWIERYAAASKNGGYNVSPNAGSQLGLKHSPETKAKIATAKTGYRHSPESRANMGRGRIGVKRSARSLQLQVQRLTGNKYFFGRRHSEETKAKMSAAAKGRVIPIEQRMKQSALLRGRTPSARELENARAARERRKMLGGIGGSANT